MSRLVILAVALLLACSCVKAAARDHRQSSSKANNEQLEHQLEQQQQQRQLLAEEQQLQQEEPIVESPALPLQYFPMMLPFQRCLFICRHCYDNNSARLLHCANDWCLRRVQKMHKLPDRAYQECPDMKFVGLAGAAA